MKNIYNERAKTIDLSVLDGLSEGVQIIDYEWRYVYVNETVARQAKLTKDELLGKTMMEKFHGVENTPLFKVLQSTMINRIPQKVENEFEHLDGSCGWFELRIEPVSEGILIISIDITERKITENKLNVIRGKLEKSIVRKDLELDKITDENQVLTKELHHRVKNNLQIISSLLRLQMNKEDDERVLSKLRISCDRIYTISLIHESLYRKASLSGIEVKSYLSDLLRNHIDSYRGLINEVDFVVTSPQIYVEVNRMIPIGLLLNELISNSLKHAFHGRRNGKIQINLTKDENEFILQYTDNGAGFIPEEIEKKTGAMLVDGFVEQIEGLLNFESIPGNGVQYDIKFSIKEKPTETLE